MTALTTESYLKRPYHIEIVWSESEDGDAGWVAEVKELRGCIAQGRSRQELLENIDLAMAAWIEDALEAGDPIPEPRQDASYSGKVLVRMPPYLHGELVAEAERQGVSLNQLAVTLLARGAGAATAHRS
ncbi:MAG: type II toxin-antitoxin system HicB family antitoxin [Dehalococcoidia bacterium]|nr:type II toxin-antitoxin system HicB family antitoxin [Dehalococcoidia bacterium]MYI86202.1 type II toxin-antitoxin system HicB family antitoxin [Dehalococcoidia bacterium]